MSDIFLSYKREDQDRIRPFYAELKYMGFDVAWDQKILTGEAWQNWILSELIGSHVVLVFWSRESIQSAYVKKEATLAKDGGKLLPVFIDRLSAFERAGLFGFDDVQSTNLSHWKGDRDDPTWRELVLSIERTMTPAYVQRQLRQKESEIHALKVSREGTSDREAELERQLREESRVRAEALKRERAALREQDNLQTQLKELDALAQTSKDATARYRRLEAQQQEAQRDAIEYKNRENSLVKKLAEFEKMNRTMADAATGIKSELGDVKAKFDLEHAKNRKIVRLNTIRLGSVAAVCALIAAAAFGFGNRFAQQPQAAQQPQELVARLKEKDTAIKARDVRISALEGTDSARRKAIEQLTRDKEELRRDNLRLTEMAKSLTNQANSLKARLELLGDSLQDDEVTAATRRLQFALYNLGAYTGEIDGEHGVMTGVAVALALPDQGSGNCVIPEVDVRNVVDWENIRLCGSARDLAEHWKSRDEKGSAYVEFIDKLTQQISSVRDPVRAALYKPILVREETLPYYVRRLFPRRGTNANLPLYVDTKAHSKLLINNVGQNIARLQILAPDGSVVVSKGAANDYVVEIPPLSSGGGRYRLVLEQIPTKGKAITLVINAGG